MEIFLLYNHIYLVYSFILKLSKSAHPELLFHMSFLYLLNATLQSSTFLLQSFNMKIGSSPFVRICLSFQAPSCTPVHVQLLSPEFNSPKRHDWKIYPGFVNLLCKVFFTDNFKTYSIVTCFKLVSQLEIWRAQIKRQTVHPNKMLSE